MFLAFLCGYTSTVIMATFWEKKMGTYFNRIDFDKDGTITRKDFEGMGERFIEVKPETAGPTGEAIKSKLNAVFDKYVSGIGGDAGTALNKANFVAGMEKMLGEADTLKGPLPLFFQAVDANSDGMIDESEYGIFFKVLGRAPEEGVTAFRAIDTNNDGLLSEEEFCDAGVKYFTNKDDENCPSKFFWGNLE